MADNKDAMSTSLDPGIYGKRHHRTDACERTSVGIARGWGGRMATYPNSQGAGAAVMMPMSGRE